MALPGDDKSDEKAFLNGGESKPTIAPTAPPAPAPNAKGERGKALRQVIASFVANFGTINTGMAFGFSAVALPQLQGGDSFLQVDEDQASWIASLSAAGTPVGCILSGYLMDAIGRKLTLILTEIPLVLGWLLIATAQNIWMIYIGRVLVGLGSGMVGAPARVYTCEVSQPHLRGMLGALASVGISFGVLLQYTIGSFCSWTVMAACSAVVPVVSLVAMLTVPETPNYLLTRDEDESARKSLAKLRGSVYNVDSEIQQMLAFKHKNHVEPLHGPREVLKALLAPSALKPFSILALYFFMYQWSGVNAITFYAVEVFQISGATINKNMATIALGAVRLIFTIVGCILLRRCGRRPLTFVSGVGCGVTMVSLGTYMYLLSCWRAAGAEPAWTWFPVACIFLFTVACTLGFLIVPWVMIGEVYPTQVRGIVGGLTTCSAHIFVFMVVKTFPLLKAALHDHGAFWFYGCISLLGCIYFYFFLPETKGRSLQEIEDYFCGRTKTLKKPKPPPRPAETVLA